MVEPHLLLPSVYVFLLLEVNLRSRNDQRSVACRCSCLCSLLRVIKCGILYIRLADNAIAGSMDCMVLACWSSTESFWWQITLALIFENMCLSAHSHIKDFTRTYRRLLGNLLKAPVAVPSHVNIKGLVSRHDLETCSTDAPASCITPVLQRRLHATPLLLINVSSACQRPC